MKKYMLLLLSGAMVISMSLTSFAANGSLPAAISEDPSYTPVHNRPSECQIDHTDMPKDLQIEFEDTSYTPLHKYPTQALFDDQGNPTFEQDPMDERVRVLCSWCKKTATSVSKALYEYNPTCGHAVYFKGYVCPDSKGCGWIKINKYIYGCSCWE